MLVELSANFKVEAVTDAIERLSDKPIQYADDTARERPKLMRWQLAAFMGVIMLFIAAISAVGLI